MAALLAPVALIGGLALAGGGFDVTARHIAGLAVWLTVVGLLVLGGGAGATLRRPFYLVAGSIVGLCLLSALSSLWSGSVELSVIEADRVLVYLSFFLAAFLIAQTDERRQRFAEGLAIATALVAVLAVASRLLPHVMNIDNQLGTGPRLAYPLGYWNADGAIFGISVALLLWTARRSPWTLVRWGSAVLVPTVLLGLYLTYSRGGLLALAVAAGFFIAASRDRLWMLAVLAIGAVGATPAVLAVQDRRALAENLLEPAVVVDQGLTVFLILLAGTALSALLFGILRLTERRRGPLAGRMVELSRHPTVLRSIAAVAALAAIAVAVAIGGRAWDQFSHNDIQFPENPAAHFSQLNGAGRSDLWRVAIDTFADHPVVGSGAGTYQFDWEEQRSIEQAVHDAHSLYLESFAELGIVGGSLVLLLVGSCLWAGFAAWRAAPHPARERYAVLLAAMLAFAIGSAFDWFWELPGLGAAFFLAAGVVVAGRCAQIAQARHGEGAPRRPYALAASGLVIAWIAAVALVGPLLVDREVHASQDAAAAGNLASAVDHAKRARSIEPWAASPYVQLGLLAELEGDYPTAIEHFTHAIEREDHNWQWYYLRSKAEHAAGDEAAAQADLARARQLNPQAECLQAGWNCG